MSHPDLKAALAPYKPDLWIFDGKKLAWAAVPLNRNEVRCQVDLDKARRPEGVEPRPEAIFRVTIRQTKKIQMSAIRGYLEGKTDFTNTVREAMNFFDHLLRYGASQRLVGIKRNFYDPKVRSQPLMDGANVEVRKGLYASIRMSHNLSAGGIGLSLNADVTNTCFWMGGQTMDKLVCNFLANCDRKWRGLDPIKLAQVLKPVRRPDGQYQSTDAFKQLRKLRRLKFTVKHSNRKAVDKVMSVQDIHFEQGYGPYGGNAEQVKFDYKGKLTSVAEYYKIKYGVILRWAQLPLIDAGRGGAIPMEVAWVEPMQRYLFKLNPDQTANMIKIAVTRPSTRKSDVEQAVKMLDSSNDRFLKAYGVEFEKQFTQTKARILPPPQVNFAQGVADPKFTGRWDLRKKKFWKKNQSPLKAWGFIVMDDCIRKPALEAFARQFRNTFIEHGGVCPDEALLLNVPGEKRSNPATAIEWAHQQITEQRKCYTQLLFIVVGQRNSPHYDRIKKNADCRWGILSQVVQRAHVEKNNGQYHSNVCMKVNGKLGGATSRTVPPWPVPGGKTYFPQDRPTMIIGVDVSHAAPGGNNASVAAMTMSIDPDGNRYAAVCETNGYRTEIVVPKNIHKFMNRLRVYWKEGHPNLFPAHVMYFRDGVAENQFAQVMEEEIGEMKRWFRQMCEAARKPMPKFTVIVATKRHHIRIFPANGDRNGNPLPGTLVEQEVTHPFLWDFYLNSHVAIQGTARPVHYYVLQDEMNCPVNGLQKMIYYQCYSYARSTTPVSLHPAVYYAHLAGSRARYHENIATSEGPRAGPKGHELLRDKVAKGQTIKGATLRGQEAPPLLFLGGMPAKSATPPNEEQLVREKQEKQQREFFRSTMWYI
jgi:eukaryotic translation initiation factor 2C